MGFLNFVNSTQSNQTACLCSAVFRFGRDVQVFPASSAHCGSLKAEQNSRLAGSLSVEHYCPLVSEA